MWQSFGFGPNYQAAYCLAVCPAGEDVIGPYLTDKAGHLREVVRPLQDKEETVYVVAGSDAEEHVARRFPRKTIKRVGNGLRPRARGRKKVEATLDGAASHFRDGHVTAADLIATYASADLACVVEVEHGRAKVGGGAELVPVAVRVTSLFRREQGEWRLVHRHADPIATPRPAESVVGN